MAAASTCCVFYSKKTHEHDHGTGDELHTLDPGMCAQGSGPGPRETSSADDAWGSVLRHAFHLLGGGLDK